MSLKIEHNQERNQFFTVVEGHKAYLDYLALDEGKVLKYYHTFVPPELRGRGIAGALVEFALNYAKDNNYKVNPSCPFVKYYVDDHPEFKELTLS